MNAVSSYVTDRHGYQLARPDYLGECRVCSAALVHELHRDRRRNGYMVSRIVDAIPVTALVPRNVVVRHLGAPQRLLPIVVAALDEIRDVAQ